MKGIPPLIAALTAVTGSVSSLAQSSVELYGIVDAGVSRIDRGQSNLTFFPAALIGPSGTTTVRSSTSNRFGLRGTESLGNGLRATFQFENRFAPDTGAIESGFGLFTAEAWVGLAGSLGEVRLGRQYAPTFFVAVATDPWRYAYSVAGVTGFTRGGNPVSRADNAVTYRSPVLAGTSVEVQYALAEGTTAVPGQSGSQNLGANLQYRGGPLWFGLAFNDLQQSTAYRNRVWNMGLAYDFGAVRPLLSYALSEVPPTAGTGPQPKVRTWIVGATAPVGRGVLKAVAAHYDAAVGVNPNASNASLPANTSGANTLKFGLGYEYPLSKRTSLYADLGSARTKGFTRSNGFQAGMKHVF